MRVCFVSAIRGQHRLVSEHVAISTCSRAESVDRNVRRLILTTPPAPEETPRLTFVGNATSVLHLGGCRILTDPSFLHAGDHAHLGYGVFAKRLLEPAMQYADLPPIDAVLLSHLHADHWDNAAERAIDRKMPIITTRRACHALMQRHFSNSLGLSTWETIAVDKAGAAGLNITAVPAQHGPQPLAALLPETNGFVIEVPQSGSRSLRIYMSGDTVLHKALKEIPQRYPEIDVALLNLGGTKIPSARVA